METVKEIKGSKKVPKIRAGIRVLTVDGHEMAVTAANQEKGIAHCVWYDEYGRKFEEFKNISELTPV